MSAIEFKTWEQVFHNEALVLEEYLSSGELASLHQSKLRIALDQKILNWDKYKNWVLVHYQVPYLAEIDDNDKLEKLKKSFLKLQEKYEGFEFLSENLFVVAEWDGHPIVLGLEPSEKLLKLPDAVFILCAPSVMNSIFEVAVAQEKENDTSSKEMNDDNHGSLGIDMTVTTAKDIDFKNVTIVPPTPEEEEHSAQQAEQKTSAKEAPKEVASTAKESPAKKPKESSSVMATPTSNKTATTTPASVSKSTPAATAPNSTNSTTAASKKVLDPALIWSEMGNRHDEFSLIARKNFDAYLVLRIVGQKTEVFKMDSDLEKEGLNTTLFSYDLTADNPFAAVTRTGKTESFNLSQLGLNILDFKYACITSLKRGSNVVGFLVGFKTTRLSAADEKTLQDLSEKSA